MSRASPSSRSRTPSTTTSTFGTDDPESNFEAKYFTGPVAGFVVDDVVEARQELEAAGVEILDDTHWSTRREGYGWFHFRAPDGNIYGLMEGSKLEASAD